MILLMDLFFTCYYKTTLHPKCHLSLDNAVTLAFLPGIYCWHSTLRKTLLSQKKQYIKSCKFI